MTQALVGALRVNLDLDTAQFSEGLKKADAAATGFASKLKGPLLLAPLAALGVSLGGISAAFLKFAGTADEAAKASRAIGVTVEELTRLQLAADRSGVGNLDMALRTFTAGIGEAREGAGAAKDTFRALGISLTEADGRAKSMRQVLGEVADRFQAMPDGVEKTTAAIAMFGSRGTLMINMLNDGAAGLRAFDDESDRLGQTISTDTAKGFEVFNDTLARIGDTFGGLWRAVSAAVLPAFQMLASAFESWLPTFRDWEPLIQALAFAFKVLAAVFLTAFQAARIVGEALATLMQTVNLASQGDFTGAWDTIKDGVKDVGEVMDETGHMFAKHLIGIGDAAEKAADRVEGASSRITTATKAAAKEAKFAASGKADWQLEVAHKPEKFGTGRRDELRGMNDELADMEDLTKSIGQTFSYSVGGAIQAAIRGADDLNQVLLNIVGNVGGNLLNFGLNMLMGSVIGGGAAAAGGGGFMTGGMGGSGLFGLLGFRDGGSWTVPGAGGPDSQIQAFRASPGETVEVRPAGDDGGRNVTVTINGATGNAEVLALVRAGVAQGIEEADRKLPQKIRDVQKRHF